MTTHTLTIEDLALDGAKEREFSYAMEHYKKYPDRELLLSLLSINIQLIKDIDFIKSQFLRS